MGNARYIVVQLFLLLFLAGSVSAQTVLYRINAGDGSDYTDLSGNFWEGDQAYVSGSYGYSGGMVSAFTDAIANTEDDDLYNDIRYHRDVTFSYTFDNMANGDYEIEFHFNDPTSTTVGQRTMDVTVEGIVELDNLDIFDLAGGADAAHVETRTITVTDGQLNIDFSPDTGDGRLFISAMMITSIASGPDINVPTASLDFGAVDVGDSLDLTFDIENVGGDTLSVDSIVSDNGVYTIVSPATPIEIDTAGTETVTVRFIPTLAQVEDGKIDIFSNDEDGDTITVTLTGSGTSVEPEIDVSPLSLDFGDVGVGDSTDLTVTISNLGTNDLTVSDLISSNGAYSIVDATPITVSNGTPVDITIRFLPTVEQTEAGDLDIVSDDSDEDTVTVSLTGVGISTDPDIDVSPLSLDFGNVTTGSTSDLTVTVDNLGIDDVVVDSITFDNTTYSVTTPTTPFTVVAGVPTDVTVQFAPDAAVTETGDMTVHSNDPDEATVAVSLTGTGSDTPDIDYRINAGDGTSYTDLEGNLWEGDQAYVSGSYGYTDGLVSFWTDAIANTEDDDLYNNMRYQRDVDFSYTFDIADGDYDIELHFNDPTSSAVGQRSINVTIEDVLEIDEIDVFDLAGGADAAHVENLTVTVSDGQLNIDFSAGTGDGRLFISAIRVTSSGPPAPAPEINVATTSLDFGAIAIGDTSELTFDIENTGDDTLSVDSLVTSNGVYTILSPATPLDIDAGLSSTVTVEFIPTAAQTEDDSVQIYNNDADESVVTVSLTGSGTSVEPEIDVTPLALDFGNVVTADSADLTVTISNLGTNDLTVSDLISSNGAYEIVDVTPITVSSGTPVDITVRFKPTLEQTEAGDLDIVSDDADEDTVTVSLTGVGTSTDPDIDIDPTSLAFGNVSTGSTSDLVVSVTNLGVDDLTVDSITIDNATYTVISPATPFNVEADSTTDVTVQFAPDVAQAENGDMTIHNNDPDEGSLIVALSGTGTDVPDIDYRVNAGDGSSYTDLAGNFWEGDQEYVAGSYGYTDGLVSAFSDAIANTEDDDLYNDVRYDRDNPFSYTFDIADGDYELELHFNDPTSSVAGQRSMDVTIEGDVVLDDFDVFAAAGGADAAYVEYLDVTVADGQLNINFDPATGDGRIFISAIRVTTAGPPPQEADIKVTPTVVVFDSIDIGSFVDATVTIENKGLDTLTVTDLISTTGDFTVESPTTPLTVVNGTPEDVTIRFSPTQTIAYSGELQIISDDIDEDTVFVSLEGVGTDPADGPTWIDYAQTNGLTHLHTWSTLCTDPEVSVGSAWGDYDGDGDLDLYVPMYDSDNILYRNDGDTNGDGIPNFVDATVAAGVRPAVPSGVGATFADYDNDGDEDLFVTNMGPNILYQNNGDGTFTDVTATAGVAGATNRRSLGVAWGDYDQDGWLDLYVTNHRYCAGEQDQALDELFRNNGDGTFTDVTDELCSNGVANNQCSEIDGLGFSVAFWDYDDDGDSDIYVINDLLGGNRGNMIWRNDGSDGAGGWLWTDVTVASGLDQVVNGMGLGIGDIDNDGLFDVTFTNIQKNWLMKNNGDGTFFDYTDTAGTGHDTYANGQPSITWSAMFIDYNNDMWVDLFYSNGEILLDGDDYHDNTWFVNNKDGTFTEVSAGSGADNVARGRHTAYADINNDGFLDYYEQALADPAFLYINNSPNKGNTNHWLKITAEGTDSNRDALGTKFTLVTPDGISQIRFLNSGHAHLGGDEKAIFFGTDSNTVADLTIRWPNGEEETFTGISVDTTLHYVEPAAGTTSASRDLANQRSNLQIPEVFKLHQNYPNPFNPETTIRYDLPAAAYAKMTVYSVLGEEVTTLVNEHQEAGFHTIRWDGRDRNGNKLASGLYIYRLKAGNAVAVKKMFLVQ